MKVKEIKEKSENELRGLIKENKERLKKLRFALANKQLRTTHEIKDAKLAIARAETVLKEKCLKIN